MTRSPVKLYEPTWRVKVNGWLIRCVDFVLRGDIAPTYRAGPWCRHCRRWWPDSRHMPASRRLACKCGREDPVALAELEAELKVPHGVLGGLGGLGGDPFAILLIGAMVMLATKASAPPWWKVLGLAERPGDPDDAKRAYRNALMRSHPDQGGSMEQMQRVRKAWLSAERDYKVGA